MASYLLLASQIADELGGRTDLLTPMSGSGLTLSPIKNAIQSAIAKWERERFYFNEAYNYAGTPLFATIAGQEIYGVADNAGIATAPEIDSLRPTISGTRRVLIRRSWAYLDDISPLSSARGQPSEWAYFAEQIRLYPIPDAVYPIAASRVQRVAALSADADTNVWTTDALDLIRCEAKLILAQEVLHDAEMAGRMQVQIYGPRGYLYALKAETARRAKSGIRPSQF